MKLLDVQYREDTHGQFPKPVLFEKEESTSCIAQRILRTRNNIGKTVVYWEVLTHFKHNVGIMLNTIKDNFCVAMKDKPKQALVIQCIDELRELMKTNFDGSHRYLTDDSNMSLLIDTSRNNKIVAVPNDTPKIGYLLYEFSYTKLKRRDENINLHLDRCIEHMFCNEFEGRSVFARPNNVRMTAHTGLSSTAPVDLLMCAVQDDYAFNSTMEHGSELEIKMLNSIPGLKYCVCDIETRSYSDDFNAISEFSSHVIAEAYTKIAHKVVELVDLLFQTGTVIFEDDKKPVLLCDTPYIMTVLEMMNDIKLNELEVKIDAAIQQSTF